MQMWNLSFGFFGVQIAYALQSANISRIFATLGADPHTLSYFWILPPLMGMLVQPVVGVMSDKTWCRLGRRKPYLYLGALVAVAVMAFLPNSGSLGLTIKAAMAFGLVMLMLLDTSINMAMQPFKMMVSSIDYNEFVGRIAVGRIERGTIKQNQEIVVCNYHDAGAAPKKAKAVSIYEFDGLGKKTVTESSAGNIIAMSGIGDITIGDTICAAAAPEPLPFVKISAPTMEMTFSINDSPFCGREGKFVTSRQIRDRLFRETLKDVSLRITEIEGAMDAFNVAGRGEMHLSILIETMRREGFELQVSAPKVLYKEIDGVRCEPIERLVADVPEASVGSVIEKLSSRKGELQHMHQAGSRMKLEFLIPSRGLFGYSNDFLTDTKGEGIMSTIFEGYEPYKGEISKRALGSLIAFESGEAVTYGLYNAQDRGTLFIGAGTPVYGGMVVGCSPKGDDIVVNVCKRKHMTNIRAAGSDDALRLTPPRIFSLEESLEFIEDDELVEVTPRSIRIRKRILDHQMRLRANLKK